MVHDLAYADIVFDGYKSPQFPGDARARRISAWKSLPFPSPTTWRAGGLGFAAGNPKIIASFAKIKSYMDYGIFTPIQVAAITALDSPEENLKKTGGHLPGTPGHHGGWHEQDGLAR